MPEEIFHAGYRISDDPARLDVDAIHNFLTQSYWARGIERERVASALKNSFAAGIYSEARAQVGLVRVITDFTSYAYLCDVYVLEEHRKKGLARAALKFLFAHPRLQGLRRWQLITKDAHPLYASLGFTAPAQPERMMEKRIS